MNIEIIVAVGIVVIFVVAVSLVGGLKKESLDVNNDGKVDLDDAKAAVEKVEEIVDAAEEVVEKIEDVAAKYGNLASKTKAKLEEIGRELGIELDRRKTKASMIAELEEFIKTKK